MMGDNPYFFLPTYHYLDSNQSICSQIIFYKYPVGFQELNRYSANTTKPCKGPRRDLQVDSGQGFAAAFWTLTNSA